MKKINLMMLTALMATVGYIEAKYPANQAQGSGQSKNKTAAIQFTPADKLNTSGTMVGSYHADRSTASIHTPKVAGAKADKTARSMFKNVVAISQDDAIPAGLTLIGSYVDATGKTIELYGTKSVSKNNYSGKHHGAEQATTTKSKKAAPQTDLESAE